MLKTAYYAFEGGLDLVTPPLSMPPGRLLGAQNYEIALQGGYSRVEGFERCSGKPKPSAASYWILNFIVGTTEVTAGQTVTGSTSGATGVAVINGVLETGTYAGNNATGYLVLYGVSGTFEDDEDLEVSAAVIAYAEGTATERGAITDALDTTYIRAAIEATRTNIAVVPGSGAIRGVCDISGTLYAFRDNAGGTACIMHKATTAGWVACDLGYTLLFDTGSVEILVNAVLTGTTSGANGTVKKVVVQSGAWGDGNAAGYVVLYDIDDEPFTNNEDITTVAGGAAKANGTGSANAFTAGGAFKFRVHNFTGYAGDRKMYGLNGKDRAFEWDGAVFSWVYTGMTVDVPQEICVFQNHLFLTFDGGSVQHSSNIDPLIWSVILGAGEIGVGDDSVGMAVLPGPALIILCRNSRFVLKGTSSDDWVLSPYSYDAGAIVNTIQVAQDAIFLDDRGLTKFGNVQEYGDFQDNVISEMVQPLLDSRKTLVTCSTVIKDKNQYILFFSDQTVLCCTFKNRKVIGFMPLDLGMIVRCIHSGEDVNGNEAVYFGSDDGFVYEWNAGTSFDGAEVPAFLRTAYNNLKSPRSWKKFLQLFLELDPGADPNISLQFAPDYSYGDVDVPSAVPSDYVDYELKGGGGYWNSANWNEFYWSSQVVATLEAYIEGEGVNIGLLINSNAIYETPHTIMGAILHYYMMGTKR
jgi:hypothetical protein